jgi:hypothetical protein
VTEGEIRGLDVSVGITVCVDVVVIVIFGIDALAVRLIGIEASTVTSGERPHPVNEKMSHKTSKELILFSQLPI